MNELTDITEQKSNHCFVLCWGCNKPVECQTDTPMIRVFCPECQKRFDREREHLFEQYGEMKVRVRYERALQKMERQYLLMFRYKDAAEVILEAALINHDRFDSSDEMMAAMELINHRIKIKTQQRVGKHRVDFMIPSMHIVLEIDGYMHEYHKRKDYLMDKDIREVLGAKWETVRIPTKHIEYGLKHLVPAMTMVYNLKKKTRKGNYGLLPDWYPELERRKLLVAFHI